MRSQPLSADVPPIVLYEGELVENGSTVAIIPTIWEWDGPDGLLERSYNNSLNRASAAVGRESFAHGRGLWESAYSHLESASSVGITDVMLDFGVRGTRPVGVTAAGSRFTFTPQLLMVSYKIAQDFQRSSGSYGAGVVPIRYTDASLFGGDYTLLIQIEFEPIASKKER